MGNDYSPCWCDNDQTTGGHQHQPVGVYEVARLQQATSCSFGRHEWTPWLRLDNGSFVTWCVHCKHREQWDTGGQ